MAVGEVKILFSTIAKPGRFGLAMVPKEGFLAYSTHLIFLIIRFVPGNHWYVLKEPYYEGVVYGITWSYVLAFMSFVYCLFVCLIIFLHFYICNVWFILANNRILVFTLKLFLFLGLLFKVYKFFLSVNKHKFWK